MVHLRPSLSATRDAGMTPTKLTTAMAANSSPARHSGKALKRQASEIGRINKPEEAQNVSDVRCRPIACLASWARRMPSGK